jgi:glycosyltransferase involved in cell wall biosynthesis
MAERKLRILQVLRSPVGGLFRHVADLTRGLAALGHEVGVVADSLSSDGLTVARLEALRPAAALGIHQLPIPRVIGPGDFSSPLAIRRLAQDHDVDVLHGHGAKGGLHARIGKLGTRRVALYTPHGGVLHFSPKSPSGLLFQTFERMLLPATDAIVFESAFARDAFQRLIGKPRCPDPVIHNGLTDAEFEPIVPAADASDFVFIGEFREIKGIRYLLEALVGVTAPGGRPATLAMAGGGPDFERFKSDIGALGLEDRVTLLGVKPARSVLPLGRIAVVPSLAESLPYVVLEAAAAGLPVVATRVGGVPEIFGPTAGDLVAPADSAALQMAMQRALNDPGAAREGVAARIKHIGGAFSVTRMTSAIEALYRQVLSL